MDVRPRVALAKLLHRTGELLRSLPVVVLHPRDMVEWSRQTYERGARAYAAENVVDAGLSDDELALWARVPARRGRVLVLGGGGGREALWFARQGCQVAAVDFSAQMLEQTRASLERRGFAFAGHVGDIALLEAPPASFDLVWTSMFLYSAVLNRARRVAMLRRIADALAPGGILVVSFVWEPAARSSRKAVAARKLVAWLTRGNTAYEKGDQMFGTLEFRHTFADENDLRAELDEGGFDLVDDGLVLFAELGRGGAVVRKRAS